MNKIQWDYNHIPECQTINIHVYNVVNGHMEAPPRFTSLTFAPCHVYVVNH